jgi:RNA polymerase sigma factor (TIGR02999 family)
MPTSTPREITQLLHAWSQGDQAAVDQLIPLVYAELHRLAKSYMRSEYGAHPLQTTALLNEAYLRLVDYQETEWESRAHFFGIAARLMRQILVDFARARNYKKRGAGARQISLDEVLLVQPDRDQDLVALDEALNALAKIDKRKSQVVEMRFFGGLAEKEIAATLGFSHETIKRDWRLAKAWLLRWLNEEKPNDD